MPLELGRELMGGLPSRQEIPGSTPITQKAEGKDNVHNPSMAEGSKRIRSSKPRPSLASWPVLGILR